MQLLLLANDPEVAEVALGVLLSDGHQVVHPLAVAPEQHSETCYDVLLVHAHASVPCLERVASVRRQHAATPVLVLYTGLEAHERALVLDAGADYVLTFPCSAQELLACIRSLERRRDAACELVAERIQARIPMSRLVSLSPRERQVLALLAHATTDHDIARMLHISDRTARFHVGSILRKSLARNRTQAAVFGALYDLLQTAVTFQVANSSFERT